MGDLLTAGCGREQDHVTSPACSLAMGLGALELLPMLLRPAMLARKLAELALCLLQPAFKSTTTRHSTLPNIVPHAMAQTLVDAVQHVTCQDVLVKSTDGLETLLLEALYQVHLGNIELGGKIFRRALAIAKSMELDKLPPTADERAKYVWFRLVYSDRWYALGTGRPSSVKDSGISIPEPAESMKDTRRLDLWQIVIGGRVIERNLRFQRFISGAFNTTEDILDLEESLSIDRDLKRAAASASFQFWASPSSRYSQDEDAEDTTARIMTQCHQNYLILLTHLPSVLLVMHRHGSNKSDDASAQYSKIASVFAARELLSRVPQFLSYPHLTSSMKGCKQKAYRSATILLLLHLYNASTGNNDAIGHCISPDINLIMETMSQFSRGERNREDATYTSYSEETLNALVHAVQDAYSESTYAVHSDWCAIVRGEDTMDVQQPAFKISYPYFGDVRGYHLGTARTTTLSTYE